MSSQFMEYEILGRLAFMDDVNEDIVNLKIAVNGKVKGEDICSWYRISAYKHTARYLRQYAGKGDMLLVKGSGYQKTYRNKDGQEVTGMQYSANRVTITRKPEKSGQESSSSQDQQQNTWSGGQAQSEKPNTHTDDRREPNKGWSSQGPSQSSSSGSQGDWGAGANQNANQNGSQSGWGSGGGESIQRQQTQSPDRGNQGNQGNWGNSDGNGNGGGSDPIPF